MEDKVCISIRRDTHSRLIALGKKKDSFDDIIQRLLMEVSSRK